MKRKGFSGTVAAVAVCMTASPALASSFSGSTFTATGSMSISAPGVPTLACTTIFSGTVNVDGTATITGANLAGGSLNICAGLTLTTPISLVANSTTSVIVSSIQINGPVPCGPQVVTAAWVNGSPSQFNIFPVTANPGNCTISVHVNVTGATIVP